MIGRALALLHDDPVRAWSVDELAHEAGTSRSALTESPMQHLTGWRMQLAADLLRSSPLKHADIAERVGYGADATFSRAFHCHVGFGRRRSARGRTTRHREWPS